MSKANDKSVVSDDSSMKAHYDFDYSKAKSNRFAERLSQESLMVVLEPDVAAFFPTSEAVNETLRVLAAALQNMPNGKVAKSRKPRQKKMASVPS